MNLDKSEIFRRGFEKIWEEDRESQEEYLDIIMNEIRHVDAKFLYGKCAFIPNHDYMTEMFGYPITNPDFDVYSFDGDCKWMCYVIFPVYDAFDSIVGLAGFNGLNRLKNLESGTWDLPVYKVSPMKVFNKSNFLFNLKGVYRKAIEEDYIILTDGTFDTISLTSEGFNACSLLSSYLSDIQVGQINCINRVYLCVDNDTAGIDLGRRLKRKIKHAKLIKFDGFKDVDDILKSEKKEEFIKELREYINKDTPLDMYFNTRNRVHLTV